MGYAEQEAVVPKLKKRIADLEDIVIETLWMARRYADGRSSYAPDTVNRAIDKAKELGIHRPITREPDYARDGDFGEWDSNARGF
jgi:hypothetical protein